MRLGARRQGFLELGASPPSRRLFHSRAGLCSVCLIPTGLGTERDWRWLVGLSSSEDQRLRAQNWQRERLPSPREVRAQTLGCPGISDACCVFLESREQKVPGGFPEPSCPPIPLEEGSSGFCGGNDSSVVPRALDRASQLESGDCLHIWEALGSQLTWPGSVFGHRNTFQLSS